MALKGPSHTLHARSASLAFSPSFFDALVALDMILILPLNCYASILKLCACEIGGPEHAVAHRPQSSSPFHTIPSSSIFHLVFLQNILSKLFPASNTKEFSVKVSFADVGRHSWGH